VAALTEQAAILNTHTRYLSEGILDYAERLLDCFPPELRSVIFTCSGSEATDLAYRLARSATGGTGFVVTSFAYHGGTVAIAELSPSLGSRVGVAPTTRCVPAPDPYRASDEDPATRFASDVRAAIADLTAHGIRPAALLVDSIFASDGIFPDPVGVLAPAADAIREAGGVFIADEVQAGFGRTGHGMWGFGRHDVTPDIVTLGKAMGGGHPIAGVVAKPDILSEFGERSRYFNTCGGTPVSCRVGMAVLDVIERDALIDNARVVGSRLVEGLRGLGDRHEVIGDVRGAGLFIGVELVLDRVTREPATAATAQLVNGLRRRRILVGSTGPHVNVLKIRPPLVFSQENASFLLEALDDALSEL
jgi:4-aminobutyrate aminotransferase-like enzyme